MRKGFQIKSLVLLGLNKYIWEIKKIILKIIAS